MVITSLFLHLYLSLSLLPSLVLFFLSLLLSSVPLHHLPRGGLVREAWGGVPRPRGPCLRPGTFCAPSALGGPRRFPPTCPPAWSVPPEQWPHCPDRASAASGEWRQAGPCSWRVGKKARGPDPKRPAPTPLSPGRDQEHGLPPHRERSRQPASPGKGAFSKRCSCPWTAADSPPPSDWLALPLSRRRGFEFSLVCSELRAFHPIQEKGARRKGPRYQTFPSVRNFSCKASARL